MTRLTLFSTIIAMTLIVAARYLAVSGAFAWLGLRRHPQLHDGLARQIRREIGWSLASAAIYAAPAAAAVWAWQERGWTRIYTDLGAYPLWWLPLSLPRRSAGGSHGARRAPAGTPPGGASTGESSKTSYPG